MKRHNNLWISLESEENITSAINKTLQSGHTPAVSSPTKAKIKKAKKSRKRKIVILKAKKEQLICGVKTQLQSIKHYVDRKEALESGLKNKVITAGEYINLSDKLNKTEYGWTPSTYQNKTIVSYGKERDLTIVPIYPDRIIHHTLLNIIEPIFKASFSPFSHQCIKGRGIHSCAEQVKKCLSKNINIQSTISTSTKITPLHSYILKIDIKKFYPSINKYILFSLIKKENKMQVYFRAN